MFGKRDDETAALRQEARDLSARIDYEKAQIGRAVTDAIVRIHSEVDNLNTGIIAARDFRREMATDILTRLDPPQALAQLPALAAWVETGEWPEVKPLDDATPGIGAIIGTALRDAQAARPKRKRG